jgi:hypothetical protein
MVTRRLRLDDHGFDENRALVDEGWVERLTVRGPASREVLSAGVRSDTEPEDLAPVWIPLSAVSGPAPGCAVDVGLRDVPIPPARAGRGEVAVPDLE